MARRSAADNPADHVYETLIVGPVGEIGGKPAKNSVAVVAGLAQRLLSPEGEHANSCDREMKNARGIMQAKDSAPLAGSTGFRSAVPAQPCYLDILPGQLAQIVVEALRRDLLSRNQTAAIFEAAGEALWRQDSG